MSSGEQWFDLALCAEIGWDWFYPEQSAGRTPWADGKAVCALCDVRDECLSYALAQEEAGDEHSRWGLWGGLTPDERAELADCS